jgi:hypothetical protein
VTKIEEEAVRLEPGSGSGRIMPEGMRQHCKESVAVKEWCEINKKVRIQNAIVPSRNI